MLKKVRWELDAVFCLKLREDLFTLCQMRMNSIMQFFAVCQKSGAWPATDLNAQKVIASVFVAETRIKALFVEKIDPDLVVPSAQPVNRMMLSAAIYGGGRFGAHLIELSDTYSMTGERMVKANLDPSEDLRTIRQFDLCGMIGDPEKLRSRLIRYFDSGVNWDDQKSFLFAGIALPPPDPDWKPCTNT